MKKTKTPTTYGNFILHYAGVYYVDINWEIVETSDNKADAKVFTYKEHAEDVKDNLMRKYGKRFDVVEL